MKGSFCCIRTAPYSLFLLAISIPSLNLFSQNSAVLGIEELYRLDLLPALKQSIQVGSISSYDRTGGNDDGFSGKFSFIRKETGGLVLADLKGPGIIYRIWTPTPSEDIMEFYFDGENSPRIHMKFNELFSGKHTPFLTPIVGSGAGGFYSYLPIPFQKACKILMKAEKVQFYQINYALYPETFRLDTFNPALSPAQLKQMDQARQLWDFTGGDISAYCAGPQQKLETLRSTKTLTPGKVVTLFDIARPGRIAGFRLGPASALADKSRSILIKMYWDGDSQPAVLSPVGDFFGYSWGDPAIKSLMVGTNANTDYFYFPMPFDRSARIELVSEASAGLPMDVHAELAFAVNPRTAKEGKFYAIWHRENSTTIGKPFTFLSTHGQGHLVGCILQAQGMESGSTRFFEGDDQTTIDGKLAIHGTGSEDFFNGGWYDVPDRWEGRKSFPLSGCLDYIKPLARSAGYRFMLTDAYAYKESILHAMEHAPENNSLPADYCATTYFYSKERPDLNFILPPLAERKVVDFRQFKFSPGWNIPIPAFSFQNVSLTKKTEKIEGNEVRYLSMQAKGEDLFGQPFISFAFDMPADGWYSVEVEAFLGPDQGKVQLYRNESPAGEVADLFSRQRRKGQARLLGTLAMQAGSNNLFFKIMGKNSEAAGYGFEPITFIFKRVD